MSGLEFLGLTVLGLGAGTWGALIGAGGGFIIVPLLLILDSSHSPASVTAVSLIAVFANGVSGASAYARLRRIDYRSALLFMVATLPGGVVGASLVNRIEKDVFQLVFGTLLSLVAVYIFFWPRRPVRGGPALRGAARRVVDRQGVVYEYRVNRKLGMAFTFVVGFLASMLGVGGGIFNVPAFVFLLGMPVQVATATSQLIMVGTSLVANVTNIMEGDLWGLWGTAAALTVGTVAGAQVGARLSQVLSALWITRVLALGLMVVGLRLLAGSWGVL